MKNWKKMIVTAAAFASLALFAGCTAASAVSADEAKELVRQTVGDPAAVVVELDSDRDDGVYELEVIVDGVGYEYEVDSRTGQLREVEREDDLPAARPAETKPVETAPVETVPAETKPVETQPQRISIDEARAIAYAHAGVDASKAYDKSQERDDGVYEIDFEYDGWEYEYEISYEGTILKSRKDRDDDRRPVETQPAETKPAETKPAETKPAETKPAQTKSDRISAEKALSIAMNHAGVSDVRDRDVEWDDGRWEVSFESGGNEYDYVISADGTILRWEKERDHDHDHHD